MIPLRGVRAIALVHAGARETVVARESYTNDWRKELLRMNLTAARNATASSAPRFQASPALRNATLVVAASAFVALCAHASVPLPVTPVPIVLSDFAVLLVGLLLGPALGFAALALYLLEGAAGLPVFSPFGLGGLAQLLGPTAGYLLAYPIAAALAGAVRRALQPVAGPFLSTLLGAGIATLLLLASGAAWLAHLHRLSPAVAWSLAILPFLLGAGIKIVAAASISTAAQHLRRS